MYITEVDCKMNDIKAPILTVLGYPSKPTTMGGLRWLKRVVDCIEEKGRFDVRKVDNYRIISNRINKDRTIVWTFFSLIDDLRDALKALFTNPDIAILDTYGETNLILWILLRFFRPKAKILTVFHHYETTSTIQIKEDDKKISKLFCFYYNHLVEWAFKNMIRNSDRIITVSISSMHQLYSLCGLTEEEIRKKVTVVGASIDPFPIHKFINNTKAKDVDFLCVGRIDKFEGIEKIWELLREKNPNANFVMIGKASNKQIDNFHKLGIDHKGIVSEDEKFSIYLRSKVFLFPSTREGFGMAVAEALYAGLSVVAWRIPVFEELYDNIRDLERLQLINRSDYQSFAREASRILYSLQTKMMAPEKKDRINNLKKWKDVSERVMKVLNGMNDQSRLI